MWMKIDFAYVKVSTKTRFEKVAWGNSEMAYFFVVTWWIFNEFEKLSQNTAGRIWALRKKFTKHDP